MPEPERLELLIDSTAIQTRVQELAVEIDRAFEDASEFVAIGVMKGSLHFLSDLLRAMKTDPRLELIRASNYPENEKARSQAQLQVIGDFAINNCELLVIDDILDQGGTAMAVQEALAPFSPKRVLWAMLLVKEGAVERTGLNPDFVGFTVPEKWVVGYGLDYAERYRNLKEIYVLKRR